MAEAVMCPACRGGKLKRGQALCPTCAQAAQEVAPWPSWALDSPLLRRALAEVNVPAVLAIVRSASGLLQQDMADVAGWSRAAMSYYERGRRDSVFDVRALLQFADAVEMPRPALLALVLGDPDAPADGTGWQAPGWVPGRTVSDARLRYWQGCVDALHERDRMAGGTPLLRPALRLLSQAWQARQQGSARTLGEALPAVAAGAALYAGQAALDSGSLAMARSLHDKAQDLAIGAQDPIVRARLLTAHSMVLAQAAHTSSSREPARQALLLARDAAEEARYEPVPQLHALIAARHAAAAALLGDRSAFETAIVRARRELGRPALASAEPVPAWLRHFGPADITAAEATGALDVGETGQSVALYRQALGQAACPRDQAMIACELAHALVVHGEADEAVAMGLDVALPALELGVTSARCLDRLRQVAAATRAVRGTLELRERVNAALRTIPHVPEASAVAPAALARVPA